jgi:hypothetical protein
VPLGFPSTDKAFGQLVQVTDAGLLTWVSLWATTDSETADEAFYVANDDVCRWERMWDDVARVLDRPTACCPVPARHRAGLVGTG